MSPVQQRKPLARRAIGAPRLAGRPYDSEDLTAPFAIMAEPAQSMPARRGPKPKSGVVKSSTERQREKRERDSQPEKYKLIAKIIKSMRRDMGVPLDSAEASAADKVYEQDGERLNNLRRELEALSVQDVRKYAETLKTNQDATGRLHNETSGRHGQRDGMSAMEMVIAAKNRGTEDADTGLHPYQDSTDLNKACGARKSYKGAAPAEFNRPEAMDDPADAVGGGKFAPEKQESEQRIDEAIHEIVFHFKSDSKCSWCELTFMERVGYENHLYAEYRKAAMNRERARDVRAGIDELCLPRAIRDSWNEALEKEKVIRRENRHFTDINQVIAHLRRREREIKRKAKQIVEHERQQLRDKKLENTTSP